VQTPQGFVAATLRGALASGADATDCAGLVEAAGGRVRIVQGDRRLLKVTTPADLSFVETLLRGEHEA
jgi:2-C-methyl-D-erythritol 4-phosphate cytidylyltransferase